MSYLRIFFAILDRAIQFAVAGAFISAFLGACEGLLIGLVLNYGWLPFGVISLGLAGLLVGAFTGAIAFGITGAMLRANSDSSAAFRRGVNGGFWLSIYCLPFGGVGGMLIATVFLPTVQDSTLHGFTFGAAIVATAGYFLGVLCGGLGRLRDFSPPALERAIRAFLAERRCGPNADSYFLAKSLLNAKLCNAAFTRGFALKTGVAPIP